MAAVVVVLGCCPPVAASGELQSSDAGGSASAYQSPGAALQAWAEVELREVPWICPSGRRLAVARRDRLVPLEAIRREPQRLGPVWIDPEWRMPVPRRLYSGLELVDLDQGRRVEAQGLPEKQRISELWWAADGRYLALSRMGASGLELWLVRPESGSAARVRGVSLDASLGPACVWLGQSPVLLCKVRVEAGSRSAPISSAREAAPVVRDTGGSSSVAEPCDRPLQSRWVAVDPGTGGVEPLGRVDRWARLEARDDDRQLLVEAGGFAVGRSSRLEIWTRSGELVWSISSDEHREVALGSAHWVPGSHRIAWIQHETAADGAGAGSSLMMQGVAGEPAALEIARLGAGVAQVYWGEGGLALLILQMPASRRTRYWLIDASGSRPTAALVRDYAWEGPVTEAGTPLLRPERGGRSVLWTLDGGGTGSGVVLSSFEQTSKGESPRLELLARGSGAGRVLWRSSARAFEAPLGVVDADQRLVLVQHESFEQRPRLLLARLASGDEVALPAPLHEPVPPLPAIELRGVRYRRADGLELSAELLMPAQTDGRPLPLLVEVYPRDYRSKAAAGRVLFSRNRYPAGPPLSSMAWLSKGFAVLPGAPIPIVASPASTKNGTYLEQLVDSMSALLDAAGRVAPIDRRRVAVIGHSYGASAVALLLAHTDLFRTGIAMSGCYNRTLTPFGFQYERRTLWQAPSLYEALSPILVADRINEPLLLIHGQRDLNPSTPVLQSEMLHEALDGLGARARLVTLPFEGHNLRARRSTLHVMWEIDRWLAEHLGPPEPPAAGPGPEEGRGMALSAADVCSRRLRPRPRPP